MKNPINKRLPRELKQDWTKYLSIFLLLVGMIGLVSGFLVADESMLKAYNDSFEKYTIEHGHFQTQKPLNKAQKKSINNLDVSIYDMFYVEEQLTSGSHLRIYANRQEVNRADVMKGRLAEKPGEIAIDRMYADNNKLTVGDTISSDKHTWTVVGLVALSDYSALFESNSDSMFDAIKFGVGTICAEEFNAYNPQNLTYTYSWLYDDPPVDEDAFHERGEDFMDELNTMISLEDYVPRDANQAITFTGEDMGSDRVMMMLLLYILIVIIGFVFMVTISNTIVQEANVIGTLMASGYTKKELIRHYMMIPVIVTLAGAVVGNVLGYTLFKNICAHLYYGSYSLPTYITIWSPVAFVETTIVPIVMMIIINYVTLRRRLSLSPLKFIRRDLTRRKQKRAVKLPHRMPFFSRFRTRILLQNSGNYLVLFVGILFANILLLFGLGMPNMIHNYQHTIETNLISEYQYVLSVSVNAMNENRKLESAINMMKYMNGVETNNEDAEKFSAYTLKTLGDQGRQEDIMVYGIVPDSRYVNLDIDDQDEGVYISSTYNDKYGTKPGDEITLKESYESTEYTFKVAGIYDYEGSVCIFMSQKQLNDIIDVGRTYFSGYFSNTPITDIDNRYLGSVIDFEALTKISRQLDVSMGEMMYMIQGIAVILSMVLMYVLSKMIIEKNAQSISMAKILGYDNAEISALYIMTTTLVVVLSCFITTPASYAMLVPIFKAMMKEEMTGWVSFNISSSVFIRTFIYGVLAYIIVAILEYRKIEKVPMDEALKNVE
ncbi:MAG: ABC transporter permease [Erysipelotrichaceae bacterium]|nr:ABC transporter permease [Erysipelotrichaceae bacterium]